MFYQWLTTLSPPQRRGFRPLLKSQIHIKALKVNKNVTNRKEWLVVGYTRFADAVGIHLQLQVGFWKPDSYQYFASISPLLSIFPERDVSPPGRARFLRVPGTDRAAVHYTPCYFQKNKEPPSDGRFIPTKLPPIHLRQQGKPHP